MMKRWIGIAVVAVLVGATMASNASAASTSHVRTISSASAGPSKDFKTFDTTLKAYDFNGDGRKEIVAHNDNRHVYVINPKSGNILAELRTTYPDGWGARPLNSPEAAILDQGGTPHIVIVNSASVVTVFRFDGAWGGEHHFTKVWEKRTTFCHKNPGNDAKPVLHDLDGNGEMDILVYTEESGVYALRSGDGSVLWRKCIAGGNGAPAVGYMNKDGIPEVVTASDNGVVTRFRGDNGKIHCSFWAGDAKYGLGAASMPVSPTIAQLNGKGPKDIVVGARDSSSTNPDNNHATLFALKGKTCQPMWVAQHPKANPLTYTIPIVHDVDNNGRPDVLWADWNTQGHKPGNWERTGPANFYRYDHNGNLVWRQTLDTYWNNKDLALADVDGDGRLEILANGPGAGGDGIWYLDARTGAKEKFISTHPWKVSRAPVIYDLYGWGTMQWVVPVAAATSSVSGGAIMIFDTGAPYNAPWPHPPAPGQPGSGGSATGGSTGGGSTGTGDFAASFQVPDTTNNWWVEAKVSANEPVAKVVARVDDEPTRLQKTDWGTWAKSFHVADGSELRFVAHSNDGDRDRSKLFTWGSGSGGSGGSGDAFTATFTPTDNRGEWWVETAVDANKPLKKVEARHSDGSWRTVEKTDWGTYAKSFHVPEGSEVRFRATDGESTVRSKWYAWT